MADSPGPSSAPITSFRPAHSLLPGPSPRTGPAVGSLRNATNGEDAEGGAAGIAEGDGQASAVPSTDASGPAKSAKPVNRSAAGKRAIIYNAVQRRNPVLQALHALKSAPTEIGDIPADYQVGQHNGLLFLSLKYHRLHPEYIHQRIEKIRGNYNYRILMVLCDVAEHQLSIRELSKIAIINELSMMVAWTNEEVARYLAVFKSYENKSADTLKERVHQEYRDQLQHVLTTGRRVNKTDASNLASTFGSFANISAQQAKALSGVKGLGATKVTSLVEAFHKPFLAGGLKRGRGAVAEPTVPEGAVSASSTMASSASGVGSESQSRKDKGKGKAASTGANASATGPDPLASATTDDPEPQEPLEITGSPEWPDSDGGADEDENGDDHDDGAYPSPPPDPRGRARAPSRSPSPGPGSGSGPGPGTGREAGRAGAAAGQIGLGATAWRDPLDDGDDGDDAEGDERAEESDEPEQAPPAKRART